MTYPPPPEPPSGYPPPDPYQRSDPNQPADPYRRPQFAQFGSADRPGRLRGRWPRRLGLVFLVVGIALVVVGAVVLAKKSFGKVNDFTRVSFAAGTKTVHLSRTGAYVGYYEAPGANRDSAGPFVELAIAAADGTPVTIGLYGRTGAAKSSLTYAYNGHDGVAVFQFTIAKAGDYAVQVRSQDDVPAGADIALGASIGTGLAVGVALLVPGVLLVVAGIVLLIVGLVKRSRHKNQRASGFGQWPGAPPGPGAPAAGWPAPGTGGDGPGRQA